MESSGIYKKLFIIVVASIILTNSSAFAQEKGCENLNFSLGDFTNWVGQTWRYSTDVTSINTINSKSTGIVNRRQTIMTDTTAYDANTGYKLKKIPSGYKYSARLGDQINSSTDSNPRCWEQSLRYTLDVDSSNALLIIKFACVLQYASDHTALMEPRFKFTLYDQNGNQITDCSNYDVYSSSTMVSGFQTYNSSSYNDPIKWRDWTTVGADLLPYIGQSITLEFMSADCTGRYHFGYAYFVAECQSMNITVNFCETDAEASLIAPDGFETYTWKDSEGNVVGNSQTLTLPDPVEGSVYNCELTSATGCTVTLSSTLKRYNPVAKFTSDFDCTTNTVQFNNESTCTNGTIQYEWDFGDGATSTESDPKHTYNTFGPKTVTLLVKNPPSTCVDTLSEVIYTFERQKVGVAGDTSMCPCEKTIIYGKEAYSYLWSTGATTDSIEVSTPGTYWVIGYSQDKSCSSEPDSVVIKQSPVWDFSVDGNPYFCFGGQTKLNGNGAKSYYWSTGQLADSITINQAGTYTVIGTNEYGCQITKTIQVNQIALPKTDFSLSSQTINVKNSTITASIPQEDNVTYTWNMGDGTTLTGNPVTHTYTVDNSTSKYYVTLTAVNNYDCQNDSAQKVAIVLFIPNVFTPNGDGKNDLFMANVDLAIYDRNGLLLYKGTDGWDGTYNGKKADNDTYFYYLKYIDLEGNERQNKGFIMLKR